MDDSKAMAVSSSPCIFKRNELIATLALFYSNPTSRTLAMQRQQTPCCAKTGLSWTLLTSATARSCCHFPPRRCAGRHRRSMRSGSIKAKHSFYNHQQAAGMGGA